MQSWGLGVHNQDFFTASILGQKNLEHVFCQCFAHYFLAQEHADKPQNRADMAWHAQTSFKEIFFSLHECT